MNNAAEDSSGRGGRRAFSNLIIEFDVVANRRAR
jgi:hypothetical protein